MLCSIYVCYLNSQINLADVAIAMENFQPPEVTARVREITSLYATQRRSEGSKQFGSLTPRVLTFNSSRVAVSTRLSGKTKKYN